MKSEPPFLKEDKKIRFLVYSVLRGEVMDLGIKD